MAVVEIVPISALQDNYIWLLKSGGEAVCVDPGDAVPVSDYLQANGLELVQIWITHHHHDHTGGVAALKAQFPDCRVYGHTDIEADCQVGEGDRIGFAGGIAEVWETPGHTDKHIGYIWQEGGQTHVFCGDTLFSAGCGQVFSGTAKQLYRSLQRYRAMPGQTLFYPTHEYTAANLKFAAWIEPDNTDIPQALSDAVNTPTLPVYLSRELKINPFLRVNEQAVRERVSHLAGMDEDDDAAIFTAMRTLKNQF
ncbi:hydroxyacylglutathione hydrolase [Neisseria sp. S1]|uniref:hydroxyacylglutathione hydrolase n=1 Tax=Neisseria sp. S1 TaxID=3318354 RepID=UPI003A8C5AE0